MQRARQRDVQRAAGLRAIGVIRRVRRSAGSSGNIATVSALAKVAGVNRSQLSTLLNDADPNPTLATFDRLVVALGAEHDFALVSFVDNAVAQAVAVGVAEVHALKQEATIRHLHAVSDLANATTFSDLRCRVRDTEAEVAAAAAREAEAHAKMAELKERVAQLHETNVALERQRADDAAEIVRLRGANATLEQLRAEDRAELARLTASNSELEQRHAEDAATMARLYAEQERRRSRTLLFGFGCVVTGAGIAAAVAHGRRKR